MLVACEFRTSQNVTHPHFFEGLPSLGKVVSLELVLTVEHGGDEIMCRPNRRWIWAELGLMEDGIELWSVQRLRLEAHSPKDVRQLESHDG